MWDFLVGDDRPVFSGGVVDFAGGLAAVAEEVAGEFAGVEFGRFEFEGAGG